MPALILTLLAGLVKAIPGLLALVERVAQEARRKQASERIQEKDNSVDAAILADQQKSVHSGSTTVVDVRVSNAGSVTKTE